MEGFLRICAQVQVWLVVIGGKISSKRRWFSSFVVTTRLFDKAMCAIATKQNNWRLLVLQRNFQNVAAGSALFRVVETRRFNV